MEAINEPTDQEFAAIEFDAWEHSEGEWTPPTNAEWAQLANPHLVSVRMAWLTMFKTKPEIMEMIRGMDSDGIFEEFGDSIRHSIEFYKVFVSVLEAAEARILCAGMAIGCEAANE